MNPRILIVDDERSMCDLLETDLRLRDFAPRCFTSAEAAFETFCREDFEVVLTDLKMPGMDGLQFCSRLVANRPDVPVIVMTAFGSLESAIAAIRAGAYDFVTKPIEMELLAVILRRAVERRQLQQQIRSLRETVARTRALRRPAGPEPAHAEALRPVGADRRFRGLGADHRGERHGQGGGGAGPAPAQPAARETVRGRQLRGPARYAAGKRALRARQGRLHRRPQRSQGTVRPGRGRDAVSRRDRRDAAGHAAQAAAGLGGGQDPADRQRSEVPVDVRILAATNRDLETAVEEGRFRKDLFYRINVIQIDLPPLRARGADILLLAQHFIERSAARAKKQVTGLSEGVAEKLLAYHWPGNVRELRNVIERAVALTRFDKLTLEDLPEKIRDYRSSQVVIGGSDPGELVPLEEVERRYILHVVECGGRQPQPGRPHPGTRSQNALPQAPAVRRAARRRGQPVGPIVALSPLSDAPGECHERQPAQGDQDQG